DQPLGRYPDGADAWRAVVPTPGEANRQPSPTFGQLNYWPTSPLPTQAVTVSIVIRDEGAVLSATLYYSVSLGGTLQQDFLAAPMQRVVGDWYRARIPPQPAGAIVAFYMLARDDQGALGIYPAHETLRYQVGHYQPPPLFINEFLADNEAVNQDEQGEYEDWIEIYNAGDAPLDVGGMYLTDDLSQPTQWRIPDSTLAPARGFVLIWADDDVGDGPLHANFKLGKGGEEIGLFDRDSTANALIDSLAFGAQNTDVSTGRQPDGGEVWMT
ncbi:MAG: lamin tail domain-containing protein, partial [Delftia sp.]|nr:lamin tail domain-containing protein [Delftia sp.]